MNIQSVNFNRNISPNFGIKIKALTYLGNGVFEGFEPLLKQKVTFKPTSVVYFLKENKRNPLIREVHGSYVDDPLPGDIFALRCGIKLNGEEHVYTSEAIKVILKRSLINIQKTMKIFGMKV